MFIGSGAYVEVCGATKKVSLAVFGYVFLPL